MDASDDARPEQDHELFTYIKLVQENRNRRFPASEDEPEEPFIELFDPNELRRKLFPGSRGLEMADDNCETLLLETRHPSEGLSEWESRIKDILEDPRGAKRKLLIADDQLLERLGVVKSKCPGFDTVIDLILRAAHLSRATKSPLNLPALLLVGPTGVGKTHFARQLAVALGVHLEFISGDLLTDRGIVTGLSPSWRAAKPGKVAAALLESSVASPLFVIDESDKVSPIHYREEPLAFLHTVLEPENAKKFTDEYLSFSMRADHCFWILTANQPDMLPPSILDRLLILPIKQPDHAAMMVIARTLYQSANARHANWFERKPGEEFIYALARHNPRKAVRIVEIAMGYAVTEPRRVLIPADIASAVFLLDMHEGEGRRVGFMTG